MGQGNLDPLMTLDEKFMFALYECEGMLNWLEIPVNRVFLYKYLELRGRAIGWYREHAQKYFDAQREVIAAILAVPDAAIAMFDFLHEEIERVEAALYSMPEKG